MAQDSAAFVFSFRQAWAVPLVRLPRSPRQGRTGHVVPASQFGALTLSCTLDSQWARRQSASPGECRFGCCCGEPGLTTACRGRGGARAGPVGLCVCMCLLFPREWLPGYAIAVGNPHAARPPAQLTRCPALPLRSLPPRRPRLLLAVPLLRHLLPPGHRRRRLRAARAILASPATGSQPAEAGGAGAGAGRAAAVEVAAVVAPREGGWRSPLGGSPSLLAGQVPAPSGDPRRCSRRV